MSNKIDLEGLLDKKTGTVYVDIDAIILWIYTANVDNKDAKEILDDIALVLQDKKEKMVNMNKNK